MDRLRVDVDQTFRARALTHTSPEIPTVRSRYRKVGRDGSRSTRKSSPVCVDRIHRQTDVARQAFDQLVGDTVEMATADAAGALDVTFTGGAHLQVHADAEYEAWNVSGPGGALVVSTAGGELSVWKPQSATNDSSQPSSDGLFSDVDEYVSDPDLRMSPGGLSGEELRDRARDAYVRLFETRSS